MKLIKKGINTRAHNGQLTSELKNRAINNTLLTNKLSKRRARLGRKNFLNSIDHHVDIYYKHKKILRSSKDFYFTAYQTNVFLRGKKTLRVVLIPHI